MIKRLIFIVFIYLVIGFQVSIASPIPTLGWDVDVVLILLVIIYSHTIRGEGIIWAIVAGLLLDAFVPEAMGGHIVAKATSIFIFSKFTDSLNLEQPLLLAMAIFLLAFVDRIIYRLFTPFTREFGWVLLRYDLPSAILTGIVGFLFLWLAMRIGLFEIRYSEES